jgi:hypothetical protein
VACTVVLGWSKSEGPTAKVVFKVNPPVNIVGADSTQVYIWGPGPVLLSESAVQGVGVFTKQKLKPPPNAALKNEREVGVTATGEPFRV